MKRTLLVLALAVLAGCQTIQSLENQSPTVNSYPQDIEQCNAQPDVIWCVQACSIDATYEWCDAQD